MTRLKNETLAAVGAQLSIPQYDRSKLKPGILHVGVGNFHRAHQAIYLDALQNLDFDPDWGICGAGVRAPDAMMRNQLQEQDWLYSVVEIDGSALQGTVVGVMTDFVTVDPDTNSALVVAMQNPETRIVSLTVTEGGYFVNSATGSFDLTHPLVAADIAAPGSAHTVFGAIVTALAARRAAGVKPFTVMSCDNLPGNGDAAREAVLGIASAIDPDLANWISDNVAFPNAMVDRITPATGARERAQLKEKFGVEDNFPVFCEPFKQWVLEDKFSDGRPDLERVGVTFTDKIHDFEKMKIRILNGGHAILAYPAALLEIEFVHVALQTPIIKDFLRKVITDDVLHLVPDVTGYTPASYLDLICQRFENPGVADQIARLCHDGSNRQPKFTISSARDDLALGHAPKGLALSAALWCRYCAGTTEAGTGIPPNDPNWDALHKTALAAEEVPGLWLDQHDIYGDVGQNATFRELFTTALRALQNGGVAQTLQRYLAGEDLETAARQGARHHS